MAGKQPLSVLLQGCNKFDVWAEAQAQRTDDESDFIEIDEPPEEEEPDIRSLWSEDGRTPLLSYDDQVEFWDDFDIHGNVRRKSDW